MFEMNLKPDNRFKKLVLLRRPEIGFAVIFKESFAKFKNLFFFCENTMITKIIPFIRVLDLRIMKKNTKSKNYKIKMRFMNTVFINCHQSKKHVNVFF